MRLWHATGWLLLCVLATLLVPAAARADGPADNKPESVRRVPPLGIDPTPEQRAHLEERIAQLDAQLEKLAAKPGVEDVRVIRRAVWSALVYQEFFNEADLKTADQLLDLADQRARRLGAGDVNWVDSPGLTALGFTSRIDGSVQPYGLVIPAGYKPGSGRRYRLDVWFHGRGETVSELRFIDQRLRQVGQYAPADTIVLHPYGRYSNAFKFAGEIDVLEAIADVARRYSIDEDRISVRGFSMGGAGCWQMAVHYADRWFAANPGAGFSETPDFLRVFQKETLNPAWYEEKLWRWYDCPEYAINLFQCPTIAYSGEIDIQKQAADIMEAALAREGIDLVHVIGPQTAHKIHADAAARITRDMDALAETGRDRFPRELHLRTCTLKYNRMHWLTIDGLTQHWEPARVAAAVQGDTAIAVEVENVDAFSLHFPPGRAPLNPLKSPRLLINRREAGIIKPLSDRSLSVRAVRVGETWQLNPSPAKGATPLAKRHDLQGPIDDAFMDSFLIVRPTGKPQHAAVGAWCNAEMQHAVDHWRLQFRGEARVKNDVDVTQRDIADANLVLFGDPQSNAVLAKINTVLPIAWDASAVVVG
ncbi:MAG: prolyl oligopeptidase family serine peptidase, partial [Planctomycetales bacterium]|nr:prolyl oligopeptidase family serine peptidase [Planctomycetales bacterium]